MFTLRGHGNFEWPACLSWAHKISIIWKHVKMFLKYMCLYVMSLTLFVFVLSHFTLRWLLISLVVLFPLLTQVCKCPCCASALYLCSNKIILSPAAWYTRWCFQGQSLSQCAKLDTILPSATTGESAPDSSELPRTQPVTAQPHAMTWGWTCRRIITITN